MAYYDWQPTFSRQTGTNGEICWVIGAKGIGKTFGLRLQCVNDFLKNGYRFAEICRFSSERDAVMQGYFDKLQNDGFFCDYKFKLEKGRGFIALDNGNPRPDWELLTYFVSLSTFQQEKKRTYANIYRYIFDEAIIDSKDRYHHYLPAEYLILANLLDSMSRQQPDGGKGYKVYLLANACDLTCPLLRDSGIRSIPEYGYSWHNQKHTLLHYVEPFDSEERKEKTLVGRMLAGNEESRMIFDNAFATSNSGEIRKKSKEAIYQYAIRYRGWTFAIWLDHARGYIYITEKLPEKARNVFVLNKKDSSIDNAILKKTHPLMKSLIQCFYIGGLRYESEAMREAFHQLLGYFGIQ